MVKGSVFTSVSTGSGAVAAARAKRLLACGVTASVLLLTGCGVQGLQWHPGIAATVGDQSITDDHVDALATGFCTAIKPQLKSSNEVAPLGVLRSSIVQGLVTRAAAEQVAAHYDVGPDASYRRALSQAKVQAGDLSSGPAAAYVELQTLGAYLSSLAEGIGGKILTAQGDTDATSDEMSAAGQKAIARWIESNDVDISPAYDSEVKDGKVSSADTDVSFAVSSTARDGYAWLTSGSPDKAYALSLPANQACG